MKNSLLSAIAILGFTTGFAQSDIIGVGGENPKSISFQDFRFIDLKSDSEKIIVNKNSEMPDQVVGMSYDNKNRRIIFIGMHSPDIYTYNLNSGESKRIYSTGTAHSKCELPKQFSRMATSSTGVSYALNNAASQLIEIRPSHNSYVVKELGALSSDINFNQYKFYGGDLIADNSGNLYLISAMAQVVKINPKEMTATFLGSIDGLETKYTTNGSAVMSDGSVLLSNAQGKGFYSLDFDKLKAEKLSNQTKTPFYDLASPYFLKDINSSIVSNALISIYPTKVTDRQITVAVNSKIEGMGQVMVFDIAGNELIRTKMNLENTLNSKVLTLNQLSPGNYIIKVIDNKGEELMNEKFILLR